MQRAPDIPSPLKIWNFGYDLSGKDPPKQKTSNPIPKIGPPLLPCGLCCSLAEPVTCPGHLTSGYRVASTSRVELFEMGSSQLQRSIQEAHFGEKDHPDLALTLMSLGNAYGSLGDVSKQRDLLEKALKIQEAHFGEKDHPDLALTLMNLGNAYGSLGDVSKQRDLLEKALKIQEAHFAEKDHPDLALTLMNLGNAYGSLGDVSKQRDLLEKALKIQEAHFAEKDHPDLALTLMNLGNAYGSLGDVSKHRDLLEKALKIQEAHFAEKEHPDLVATLANLAPGPLHLMEVLKIARQCCERAWRISAEAFGPQHPSTSVLQHHLQRVLQKHKAPHDPSCRSCFS